LKKGGFCAELFDGRGFREAEMDGATWRGGFARASESRRSSVFALHGRAALMDAIRC